MDKADEAYQAALKLPEESDKTRHFYAVRVSQPGYGDNPYWLDEFSLVAARNGVPELAMRLWRVKANMDLTNQAGLDDLAASGLRDRLRDYYTALAKRAPKNAFVAVALEQLARP